MGKTQNGGTSVSQVAAKLAPRMPDPEHGSHRADMLRDFGFALVPCVVPHVSTRDELEVVAASAIRRDPDYYLKHARPSMRNDYPNLRKVMPVHRPVRQITVKFHGAEDYIPAV